MTPADRAADRMADRAARRAGTHTDRPTAIGSGASAAGAGWLGSATGIVRRRFDGTNDIDPWGLDLDLVDLLSPAFAVRWSIEVQWPDRIPSKGPAVLVHNRVVGVSEPVVLARGIRRATGRPVRTAGLVDRAPVASLGRALGAVVDRPEELTAVLRSGALVGLPLDRDLRPRRAGGLSPEALAPALGTGAAVIPVALVGREVGRRWRVLVGEAIDHPPGQGPLAVADLVDAARAGVQDLIDSASVSWL